MFYPIPEGRQKEFLEPLNEKRGYTSLLMVTEGICDPVFYESVIQKKEQ
ncbi:MAG: hypothetical protein WAT46_04670 [Saprospiraceae bacterium]|nr:hypothetical protein [Saprospiraceae bacterium]